MKTKGRKPVDIGDTVESFVRATATKILRAVDDAVTLESLMRSLAGYVDIASETASHLVDRPACASRDAHLLNLAALLEVGVQPALEAFGAGGTLADVQRRMREAIERRVQIILRDAEVARHATH